MTRKWTDMPEMPKFFDRYITKVADLPLNDAFAYYNPSAILADKDLLLELGDRVYAPGKWTVKDILQHLTERKCFM